MRVVSLGSGSSGNALLVEAGATRVLLDAGFQPRVLRARLRQAGVAPEALTAILLTHEHHDHACGAAELALAYGIPLVADPRTLDEVLRAPEAQRVGASPLAPPRSAASRGGEPERAELRAGRRKRVGALEVRSFPVSHDAVAPCGYVLSAEGWSVCVAVDTGEVGAPMAEALREAHLLVIEANHDEALLESGPYPRQLKRRIRSATGHLSNRQTSAALAATLDAGPRWVWLAHLSRTNNTPDLARATVQEMLRARDLRRVALQVVPPGFGLVWESPGVRQPSLWTADARPADLTPDPSPVRGRGEADLSPSPSPTRGGDGATYAPE